MAQHINRVIVGLSDVMTWVNSGYDVVSIGVWA
jgi:hypothetical protein